MKQMKVGAALLLAALLTVMLAGCFTINLNSDAVVGNGEMETREITLENAVTGVSNQTSIDVIIDPDLSGKAVLDAESNLIDLVEVTQGSDGLVTVDIKQGVSIMIRKSMTLRIPAMEGGRIEINGSGNISLASGTLTGGEFDVQIAGSGDIRLALDAQSISLSIDGSGDIELSASSDMLNAHSNGSGEISISGEANQLDVNLNGSGDFSGFDFAVPNAKVTVSGSGNADVFVTGNLTGSIGGSGDITYDGNPQSVSISENGSGDANPR